jgi:hypothetical protein
VGDRSAFAVTGYLSADTPIVIAISRRADPERIIQARRVAVRNGLTDYGMSLGDAERCCDAWEAEAAAGRLPRDRDYWRLGKEWIAERRAARRPPF